MQLICCVFPRKTLYSIKRAASFIVLPVCSLPGGQQVPKVIIPQAIPSHYANLLAFLKMKTKQLLEEKRGGGQGEGKENQVSGLEELS